MHRHAALHSLTVTARWLPVVAAVLGTSCAGGLNHVEGKVLYKGGPARGAIITFHPKAEDTLTTPRPSGVVRDDGTFTLSTRHPNDGAAAGEYLVTIVWPEDPRPARPTFSTAPPPDPPDRLKGRYADRTRSGLTAVVKSGSNQLPPFEVK